MFPNTCRRQAASVQHFLLDPFVSIMVATNDPGVLTIKVSTYNKMQNNNKNKTVDLSTRPHANNNNNINRSQLKKINKITNKEPETFYVVHFYQPCTFAMRPFSSLAPLTILWENHLNLLTDDLLG